MIKTDGRILLVSIKFPELTIEVKIGANYQPGVLYGLKKCTTIINVYLVTFNFFFLIFYIMHCV